MHLFDTVGELVNLKHEKRMKNLNLCNFKKTYIAIYMPSLIKLIYIDLVKEAINMKVSSWNIKQLIQVVVQVCLTFNRI